MRSAFGTVRKKRNCTVAHMREWPEAWRAIDTEMEAAPLPGERVFGAADDVARRGYPTDHLPSGLRPGGP